MSQTNFGLAALDALVRQKLIVVSRDGMIVDGTAAGRGLFGLRSSGDAVRLHPFVEESEEECEHYLRTCRRTTAAIPGRLSLRGDDGQVQPYLVRGAALRGAPAGTTALLFEELSESSNTRRFHGLNETIDRLRAEVTARRRIEAVLEAQKQTLAAVVTGRPLSKSLEIVVRALESHCEGLLVSILLLDEDNRLRHSTAPSLPDAYCTAIDGLAIGEDVGSCGTAAYTGELVISADLETDPRWADFRDLAADAGLRACWSCPVKATDGSILGTLAMYSRTPHEPTPEEIDLISSTADITSTAIERFRAQELVTDLLQREQQRRAVAESESKAKDDFLAMLGHELRNPLGAIMNATHALRQMATTSNPDLETAEVSMLDVVLAESSLLKRILDDLLDISRLSRGKLQLRKESFAVEDFVRELKNAVHSGAPGRDIRFEVEGELGDLHGDRSRIRQSIHNLVHNALKFSQPEQPVVVRFEGTKNRLRVHVIDLGRGIETSDLPVLFEAFSQGDTSLERNDSGLGLGLALVRRFVEMHGGKVSAHSDGLDRGSQFTLELPRGHVEPSSSDESAKSMPCDGPKKILVAEDNLHAREGLCQLLELLGHEVIAAGDGGEAVELIEKQRPDLAFVDIGLPIMDGHEVARMVRRKTTNRAITLVALTGYGQPADRERALDAGFDLHMVKPAEIDALIELVGEPAARATAGAEAER